MNYVKDITESFTLQQQRNLHFYKSKTTSTFNRLGRGISRTSAPKFARNEKSAITLARKAKLRTSILILTEDSKPCNCSLRLLTPHSL